MIKSLLVQPNKYYFSFLFSIGTLIFLKKDIKYNKVFYVYTPILWTFQEYIAHRFLLHNLFYRIHNKHHKNTQDTSKLFIPIFFTQLFALINFTIYYNIFELEYALINLSSNIYCYLLFEYTHWFSHFSKENKYNILINLKNYHKIHHNRNNINYGFTSASWDIIFNTYYNDSYDWKKILLIIPYPIIPFILNKNSKNISSD